MPPETPLPPDTARSTAREYSLEQLRELFPAGQEKLAALEQELQQPKFQALRDLQSAGAEVYLVGGIIRDALLGAPPKDFDFIIRLPRASGLDRQTFESWFGTADPKKETIHGPHGSIKLVGAKYGVYKFTPAGSSETFDLAFPRREQPKTGNVGGRKDFDIQSDPALPVEDDLSRRDFTVNALVLKLDRDPAGAQKLKLLDFFGGLDDLAAKKLRAVGDPAARLREDNSRILRALRFETKLGLTMDPTLEQTIRDLGAEAAGAGTNILQKKDGHGDFVIGRTVLAAEFLKGFASQPARYIARADELGLLPGIIPDLYPAGGQEGSVAKRELRQRNLADAIAALQKHRQEFPAAPISEYFFLLIARLGQKPELAEAPTVGGAPVYARQYRELSGHQVRRLIREVALDSLPHDHQLRLNERSIQIWLKHHYGAISLLRSDVTPENFSNKKGFGKRLLETFPALSQDPLWRLIQTEISTSGQVGQAKNNLASFGEILRQLEDRHRAAPVSFSEILRGDDLIKYFAVPRGQAVGTLLRLAESEYHQLILDRRFDSPYELKQALFAKLIAHDQLRRAWCPSNGPEKKPASTVREEDLELFSYNGYDRSTVRRLLLYALADRAEEKYLGANREPADSAFVRLLAQTERDRPEEFRHWLQKSPLARILEVKRQG